MNTTSKKQIYLDAPNVGNNEIKYLKQAIKTGYVSTYGPFVPQFEKELANIINAPSDSGVVTTQSGTAALHLALYVSGISSTDEVIIPALTFIATANAVKYVGARLVFADVKPDTWTLDPSDLKQKITSRTKAIIPVHLYGNPCDMDEINDAIPHRYRGKIVIIEDATESLGAYYKKKHTGTIGDYGCFSFNGNKIITTGGGGAITSPNIKIVKRLKSLVNQARDPQKDKFNHSEIGFNYRMTNLEAAMGLAQIKKLDKFLLKKKLFRNIYEQNFQPFEDQIKLQRIEHNSISSNWLTCVSFRDKRTRIKISNILTKRKIPYRQVFPPIFYFKPYKKLSTHCPNSISIYNKSICLPSSTLNNTSDIQYVCDTITTGLKNL